MRWAGWSVAPGVQFSFVPLVSLGEQQEKKKSKIFFFFCHFAFSSNFASQPRERVEGQIAVFSWADVSSGGAVWEKFISGV